MLCHVCVNSVKSVLCIWPILLLGAPDSRTSGWYLGIKSDIQSDWSHPLHINGRIHVYSPVIIHRDVRCIMWHEMGSNSPKKPFKPTSYRHGLMGPDERHDVPPLILPVLPRNPSQRVCSSNQFYGSINDMERLRPHRLQLNDWCCGSWWNLHDIAHPGP